MRLDARTKVWLKLPLVALLWVPPLDGRAAARLAPAPASARLTQETVGQVVAEGARALESGDLVSAERLFRQAMEKGPTHALARIGLSQVLARRGESVEALVLAREAQRLDPEDATVMVHLGRQLARNRAVDEAGAAFAQARALGVSTAESFLLPALLLRDAGRVEEAISLLEEAHGALAGDPQIAGQLGLLLLDSGHADRALEVTRKALAEHSEAPGLLLVAGLAGAEQALTTADPEAKQQSEAEAVDWLERALAVGAQPAGMAHLALGKMLIDLGRNEAGVEHLLAATRALPESSEAHYRLATALRVSGDLDGAARALERFEQLQASDDEQDWGDKEIGIALNEAQRLASENRFEEALARVNEILARADDHRGYALRAKIRFSQGAGTEALSDLQQARARMPNRAEYHYLEGGFLRALERSSEAREALKRAVALDPALAEAHSLLGLLAAEDQRFPEAIASYERALELGAEGATLRRSYAQVLAAVGRNEESEEQLRLAEQASSP